MPAMTLLVVFGCIMIFAAGILIGYALRLKQLTVLIQTGETLSSDNAAMEKKLHELGTKHDSLVNEHARLTDSYHVLQKNYANRDTESRMSTVRTGINHKTVSDYEKAAFEYAEKIEQLAAVQKENRVLAMQVAVQKKHISELEQLKKYFDRYNELDLYTKELKAQNSSLQKELAALKNADTSHENAGQIRTFKTISSGDNLADVCNKILASTASLPNSRGAAISDEMGFTIAASSAELADELAGISMLYHYCQKLLDSNISFGKVTKITLKSVNNLFLTVMPIIVNGQTVFYSGLSHGRTEFGVPAAKVTSAVIIT